MTTYRFDVLDVDGTLNVDGAATIGGILTLTAGKITFPSTQSASANVNTLDDYEEGSWTPSVGGTATYTTQSGKYVKVGKHVYASFNLTVNAIGTGSPSVMSGLPFLIGTESYAAIGFFASLSPTVVFVSGIGSAATTAISFYSATAASTGLSSNNILTSGSTIRGHIVYEASA